VIAPWRTGMPGRPEVPVPPASMPMLHAGRPLKRWRWVGAFSDELMLCAAVARIGPVTVSWWAAWDRSARTFAEHTMRHSRAVTVDGDRVEVDDGPVRISLAIEEAPGVETISQHGPGHIWTCKRPARARGAVTLAGRSIAVDAPAFVDESAGYHARETAWRWSAGVGTTTAGVPVTWNLVTGLHDAEEASERTVWVGGEPHHVAPQAFADDLSSVGGLHFTTEATRKHRENRLIVASDYEQPFGAFAGELPVAGEITGYGVMERHAARW
jgi:Protein of unknown function (DUF2804)